MGAKARYIETADVVIGMKGSLGAARRHLSRSVGNQSLCPVSRTGA